MKEYSSLHIGGKGDIVVVRSSKELMEALSYASQEGITPHVLGEGTNTYFGENLSNYLFIKNQIKGISFEEKGDDVFLTASAGERWDDIVSFAVEKKLWGIENLSLIPGTVGAAPIQNIGAYGVELKDTLVSLSAYDTKTSNTVEIPNEACLFGYRDSVFKQEKNRYIILSITLKLSYKANPILTYKPLDTLSTKENCTAQEVRDLVIVTRKEKLPDWITYPNTGSFFKNPVVTSEQGKALLASYPDMPLITHPDGYKIPAAWLIEHIAHMKGQKVKDIGTWPNQPLVIVNYGNTNADELNDFAGGIQNIIHEKTGIQLEREVNFIA